MEGDLLTTRKKRRRKLFVIRFSVSPPSVKDSMSIVLSFSVRADVLKFTKKFFFQAFELFFFFSPRFVVVAQ